MAAPRDPHRRRFPIIHGKLWVVRTPPRYPTLAGWYRTLCIVLSVVLLGVALWILGLAPTGGHDALYAAAFPALIMAVLWIAFLDPWVRTRHARGRLVRLDAFLAKANAARRFPHRVLERRLLEKRLGGRDILSVIRDPGVGAPPCVILWDRTRTAMPIPRGAGVSFEPIGLDTDRPRCEEFFAITSPSTGGVRQRSIWRRMAARDPRVTRLVSAAVPLFAVWSVVVAWVAESIGRRSFGGLGVGLCLWLALMLLFTAGLGALGWRFRAGRWWVAPQTVIVNRSGARHEVFRRSDSRLWIDQTGWSAWLVRGDVIRWRGLRRMDVPLLSFGWLASVDPPPVSETEMPT